MLLAWIVVMEKFENVWPRNCQAWYRFSLDCITSHSGYHLQLTIVVDCCWMEGHFQPIISHQLSLAMLRYQGQIHWYFSYSLSHVNMADKNQPPSKTSTSLHQSIYAVLSQNWYPWIEYKKRHPYHVSLVSASVLPKLSNSVFSGPAQK